MIRANLTSIVAIARPIRMVPVEEFDLMVGELEELRRRERERMDLAYEERAAVVAYLHKQISAATLYRVDDVSADAASASVAMLLAHVADTIDRGVHRREEEP